MAGPDESHTNLAHSQITVRDAVPLARGTVLAGRYEIETTLGRGGAGVVLRAHDRELREAVAIKILHPELSQQTRWIERLAREVKLARQLRHPNVCRVFDFEKADGHVFIVMELATGGSLREELQDRAHVARSPEARLVDARAVADGLAAIHQAGIAHRDVTPQNVLRMADGRLVVSDFGLATEISQTTASVHGGTIAYMAPEVVRGQRADFAADVWSLGVVIHEIMFGGRPTWSKASGGAMLTPLAGRTLAKSERLVYDICRACTADRPGDRPASASEVTSWLGGRRQTPRRRARRWIALALMAVVAVAGAARLRWSAREGPTVALEPTGEPADWTETSKVLATFDGPFNCLTALPGAEAVRFGWGNPPQQVEDLDLVTGLRRPATLVPAARKTGCAQPSPDGKHLAYQDYAADGRAFAFVADNLDGSGASPVVPIADPSIRSDPAWLSDKEFVIDIDHQHAGVFSLETHRTKVLREVTSEMSSSVFRSVVGSTVLMIASTGQPLGTDIVGFEWPLATEKLRFRIAGVAFQVTSVNSRSFLMPGISGDHTEVWQAEPARHSLKRVAEVRGQFIGSLVPTKRHLVFVSHKVVDDAWLRFPDGHQQALTHDGGTTFVAPCGRDVITIHTLRTLVRLDRSGRRLESINLKHLLSGVACSPDGSTWFTAQRDGMAGGYRCTASGCSLLVEAQIWTLAVSPNGERLAFVKSSATGLVAAVMPTTGGEPSEVAVAETPCQIAWSSDRTIWVPKRRDTKPVWVEVDVASRAETGRTKPGSHDCADGMRDPDPPVKSELEIIHRETTQIRSIPSTMLGF